MLRAAVAFVACQFVTADVPAASHGLGKQYGFSQHAPLPTLSTKAPVQPTSHAVKPPTGRNCPGPYDDCTQARCCSGGEDTTGMPVWVCSTLVLPSTQYRCYHMKEITEYGSANAPVSTKLKARLKSEVSSIILADDECARARAFA